jgi:hypothetical protein
VKIAMDANNNHMRNDHSVQSSIDDYKSTLRQGHSRYPEGFQVSLNTAVEVLEGYRTFMLERSNAEERESSDDDEETDYFSPERIGEVNPREAARIVTNAKCPRRNLCG